MQNTSIHNQPSRFYFYAMAGLFIISILLGIWTARSSIDETTETIREIFSPFSFVRDLPAAYIFLYIFLNNTIKAFFAVILGVFFGIFPIFFILSNGEIIGLVYAVASAEQGSTLVLAALLPHGILESIAIIMAAGYGVWLGVEVYRRINRGTSAWEPIKSAIRSYFLYVFPMLLMAALIEAYITPVVMVYFANR